MNAAIRRGLCSAVIAVSLIANCDSGNMVRLTHKWATDPAPQNALQLAESSEDVVATIVNCRRHGAARLEERLKILVRSQPAGTAW